MSQEGQEQADAGDVDVDARTPGTVVLVLAESDSDESVRRLEIRNSTPLLTKLSPLTGVFAPPKITSPMRAYIR